jgi:uncharacterized protein YukE
MGLSSKLRVDIQTLEQAAGNMHSAAQTTSEATSQVMTYSRPVTGSAGLTPEFTGSMVATDALYGFWYSLQEQLTLAGEVFDELGTGLHNAALSYQSTDQKSASSISSSTSQPVVASNTPQPVTSGTASTTQPVTPSGGTAPGGYAMALTPAQQAAFEKLNPAQRAQIEIMLKTQFAESDASAAALIAKLSGG